MAIKKLFLLFFLLTTIAIQAQNKTGLVSGPWAGRVEIRSAAIWVEVTPKVRKVAVQYAAENNTSLSKIVEYRGELGKDFNPVQIELNGLDMNTSYRYSVLIDGKVTDPGFPTKFITKDLWQWRKPAPDFSFLTGSCAYFNEPVFDRPGRPYGGDSSIFESMAKMPAAFHLWLGDNWYTREVDYATPWGLNYRASHDRAVPELQKLMSAMPQYAIWDDHDYGPNDIGKSYLLKDDSRRIFMNYFMNYSYGEDGKGIYSQVSYSDVDIFLTDDRYFRSEDNYPDSINGQPNAAKKYFGDQQMDWLKNALLFSKATFKIIASGSQVLNGASDYEGMRHYPAEYNELLNFLSAQKIKGVLFFSGDRHHSEIIKAERPGLYPLYDVTVSPYTSGVSKVKGRELNNPARVPGTLIEDQNFAKVTVSGKKDQRQLKVDFFGTTGNKLAEWVVSETELSTASPANKE